MHDSYQAALDARAESQRKYDKEHTVSVSLKLNLKTDTDILSWLKKQPQKQTAIKAAIRKQIVSYDASE